LVAREFQGTDVYNGHDSEELQKEK
jgi:hypothetical protein